MKPAKSALVLTTILIATLLWIPPSFAAPNAIYFQGRVNDAFGIPVSDGVYSMLFLIYNVEIDGSALWGESQDVAVNGGIYNVTLGQGTSLGGNFDAELFNGDDRWLEVWFDGEALSPRQKIASVAYALQAGSTTAGAVTSVMLADEAVTEAKVQDGSITAIKIAGGPDSGLDSDTLDGYQAADFAPAAHNHNTQYYTKTEVDNLINGYESRIAALEDILAKFSVSDDGKQIYITEANLHVRSGSGATDGTVNGLGNLIIGYNENRNYYSCSLGNAYTDQDSCENAGGQWWINNKTGSHNLVVGTQHNYNRFGGIVAGASNTISGIFSSISGGFHNTASGDYSSVSSGSSNDAIGQHSSVSGGRYNSARNYHASISGGNHNEATGSYSSVSGGSSNTAGGDHSSLSGGSSNTAGGDHSSLSGGYQNEATGNYSSVSGGGNNRAEGDFASVSGGGSEYSAYGNVAYADYSSVLGGIYNITGDQDSGDHAIGKASTVSGGDTNRAIGTYANVSGGKTNIASGYASSVSGGRYNESSGQYSFVGGGGSYIESAGNDAIGNYSAILGGQNNITSDLSGNHSIGEYSTVCGGAANQATGLYSSVSGGGWNIAEGERSTVGGGRSNIASGDDSSVVGDVGNTFVDSTSIP
jgi:hypothetical protein